MWLLVGGDSEIGAATFRHVQSRGRSVVATTRRPERVGKNRQFLDLAAPLDHWQPPPATRAACIFAAIARIGSCHDDPAGSAYVNVTQTLMLIERLIARGIYVLFLSTNQVFDGRLPNVSADTPHSPVTEYGRQKAKIESALCHHMDRGAAAAILRMAKVVSPDMPLIKGWIAALMAGVPIRAFDDMMIAPTPIELIASSISALMHDQATGIFQLTGPRDVTYAEVAQFLASRVNADPGLVTTTSARASGLPEGATPRHTTLDSQRLLDRYRFSVPDVWDVIEPLVAVNLQSSGSPSISGPAINARRR